MAAGGVGLLFKRPCHGEVEHAGAAATPQDQAPETKGRGRGGSADPQAHSWDCCLWSNLRGSWAPSLGEDISLGSATGPTSWGWSSFRYQVFWKLRK